MRALRTVRLSHQNNKLHWGYRVKEPNGLQIKVPLTVRRSAFQTPRQTKTLWFSNLGDEVDGGYGTKAPRSYLADKGLVWTESENSPQLQPPVLARHYKQRARSHRPISGWPRSNDGRFRSERGAVSSHLLINAVKMRGLLHRDLKVDGARFPPQTRPADPFRWRLEAKSRWMLDTVKVVGPTVLRADRRQAVRVHG